MEVMQAILQEVLKITGVIALALSVVLGAYVKRGYGRTTADVIERTEFNHTIASVRTEIRESRVEVAGLVERGNDRIHARLDELVVALTTKKGA